MQSAFRSSLLTAAFVIFGPIMCIAGSPAATAPISSLSVYAKEKGSAMAIEHNWETDYGSYDRDYFRKKDIEIEVRNMSNLPATVDVEVYFLGQLESGGATFILSRQTIPMDLRPAFSNRVSVASEVIKSNKTNYAALGQSFVSGSKFKGWLVIGKMGDRQFSLVANNPALITRREDVERMLKEFKDRLASQ